MSADNGLLLWKNSDGMYVISEYSASVEYETPKDMHKVSSPCSTISLAIVSAYEYMSKNTVEYGLNFDKSCFPE